MNLYQLKQMNKSELAFANLASEMLLYSKNAITQISISYNYKGNTCKSYVSIDIYNPFERKSKTRHYTFDGYKHFESANKFVDMVVKAFNCKDIPIKKINESREVF